MPRSRSFVSLGLLITGLLVSATCSGDVVGPPAGTEFVATRLDDQALPAVWGYDASLEFSLLEDRNQFLGDRRYVNRTIHFQVRDLRNGVVTDELRQGRWEYRLRGSVFLIGFPGKCGPGAICTAPDSGTIAAGVRSMRPNLVWPSTVTYARQQAVRAHGNSASR